MYIYKITNTLNNKSYIGKRIRNNKKDILEYYGSGSYIKNAIAKHGKEHFSKTIIAVCKDINELNVCEYFWINKLNTIAPNGYNLIAGGKQGTLGYKHTNESINKISVASKNRKFELS